MSAKRTAMRKLREVLRLSYSADLSIRKISANTKISVGSIQNILKLAEQLKITWPLPEDWDDQTLALKFYPRSDAQPSSKFQEPVWTDVHLELKKKGVTKQLLWEEYTRQYPNRCSSYSQFCARYSAWRRNKNAPCAKYTMPYVTSSNPRLNAVLSKKVMPTEWVKAIIGH